MSAQLERIMELNGLKRYGDIAYGSKNGIYVNVVYNRMTWSANVHFFIGRESGVSLEEINLYLKENRKKYRAKPAQINGSAVSVLLNSEIKRIKPEDVAVFVDEATAFLAEHGYVSGCAVCGQDSGEGYTLQGGFVQQMCAPCHEKLTDATTEIKRERAETGSYLTGLVGAVLGGIIGIIPWVLIGMLGYIAGISGFIMAFLSYKGYLLLRGKRGPGMTWIMILVLIVFTYIAVLTSEGVAAYQMLTDEGYIITAAELVPVVIAAPFMPESGPLWGSIAIGWFFAGLGSFTFLRKLNKEAVGADLAVKRVSSDLNQ